MKNKLLQRLIPAISVVVWLAVWEMAALIVNIRFILPTVTDVFVALLKLIATTDFWLSTALSLLRITIGLVLGIIIAVSLAVLARFSQIAYWLIAPLVKVIRATPVASFIMVVWLLVDVDNAIPVIIALLMVFPVVWQCAYDGLTQEDPQLLEVAEVYRFSFVKRLRYLTIPTTFKFVLPGIVTASGLAWKSGIAAEIITYVKNSIGKGIADSKNALEGADMFAWTFVVILFSLLIEAAINNLTRRVSKLWE